MSDHSRDHLGEQDGGGLTDVNLKLRGLPRDFVWGAATAAYQIEGSVAEAGRGPSIWDVFCAEPGRIIDGSSGAVACDHYGRWQEDVALLRELGLQAYRFSVAWPRILPTGAGTVNSQGLDFYSRLVDALLEAGITPWVTLYHWDLPAALEEAGGWRTRTTAVLFADYAEIVVRCLGDRVQHWLTLNEPWCSAVLGYRQGQHAPGVRSRRASLQAAHHLLLGHGLAMERIRGLGGKAKTGIALNLAPVYCDDPADATQQRALRFLDGDVNRWYLDPLLKGHYPEDMQRDYQDRGFLGQDGWDFVAAGDAAQIAQPLDFLGVNYYTRFVVGRPDSADQSERQGPRQATAMGWEVYPQGLKDLFDRLASDYPMPAYYITENGAAYTDQLQADGTVEDVDRLSYFQRHLAKVAEICVAGIPLQGYFAWSIIDNFEWSYGYTKRFGLVYIDYPTQKRLPKRSFRWLQERIAAHRRHD